MYALIQTGIEWIPSIPDLSLQLELPLSFLDALSRTLLLVHVVPAMVLDSPYPQIAGSPWALLVTSLVFSFQKCSFTLLTGDHTSSPRTPAFSSSI